MAGPILKVPKIDPANIASKLPEPLRKPAGMALQGLMDIFGGGGDVSDVAPTPMTPAAAAVRIPFNQLQNLLRSGFAEDMISKAKSPTLRGMYDPDMAGSPDIARIASGIRSGSSARMAGHTPKPVIPGLDLQEATSKADSRLAAQELYNISQRALDELRVPKNESIEVFRRGYVPSSKELLTPTHVDDDLIQSWRAWDDRTQLNKYNVPREQIRAIVGLLRRGDDLTEGELLIPAHNLIKNAQLPVQLQNPGVAEQMTRIPSWFKKSVR